MRIILAIIYVLICSTINGYVPAQWHYTFGFCVGCLGAALFSLKRRYDRG